MILQEAVPVPERSYTFTTQILTWVAYSSYLKVHLGYDLHLFFLSPSYPSIKPTIATRQCWKVIPYQVEIDQLRSQVPHHFFPSQGCMQSSAHEVEVEH